MVELLTAVAAATVVFAPAAVAGRGADADVQAAINATRQIATVATASRRTARNVVIEI